MKQPTGHVLLVDANLTRRHLLASAFRAAGCVVLETSKEHEVVRTLAANKQTWVLAVADSVLTLNFRDLYPNVPMLLIGGHHENAIAGRVSIDDSPHLSAQVHGLVSHRGMFS